MIDAYKIGMTIAMKNEVSQVLSVIQRDMLGLRREAELTEGALGRMKLAFGGFAFAIGGLAIADGLKDLVKAGIPLVQ